MHLVLNLNQYAAVVLLVLVYVVYLDFGRIPFIDEPDPDVGDPT